MTQIPHATQSWVTAALAGLPSGGGVAPLKVQQVDSTTHAFIAGVLVVAPLNEINGTTTLPAATMQDPITSATDPGKVFLTDGSGGHWRLVAEGVGFSTTLTTLGGETPNPGAGDRVFSASGVEIPTSDALQTAMLTVDASGVLTTTATAYSTIIGDAFDVVGLHYSEIDHTGVTAGWGPSWDNFVVRGDASGGATDWALPATTNGSNYPVSLMLISRVDNSANAFTITPAATETINGSTSAYSLTTQNEWVWLASAASSGGWRVIASGNGPPTGAAGGVLTGTYPSPGLAAAVVGDSNINPADPIAESKLILASDATSTTSSRRISTRRSGASAWKGDMWGGAVSTVTLANGTTYFTPIFVVNAETWSQVGLRVVGAGSAGAVIRAAVYNDNGAALPLGSLVADLGTTVATAANTTVTWTWSTPPSLTPGLYWLAFTTQGTPATVPTANGTTNCPGHFTGAGSGNMWVAGWSATAVGQSAYPTTIGTLFAANFRPLGIAFVTSRP